MHKQAIVLLLLGLTASIYGLDLSHAAQSESSEVDARLFNFINDFYAQVMHPPLNHIVTNLALIGAQFLVGVSQTGISAPGGRSVHLTESELRGFWSGLWNDAVKPPIENAMSAFSLMAAQVLGGIALNGVNLNIGKRDLTAEDARILDALTQALSTVFTQVMQKPMEAALSNGALMMAQVLAGLGTNGVDLSSIGSLFGKRDLTAEDARILDVLTQALSTVFTQVMQKPMEAALSNGALMMAQVLAGLGTNGVDLSSIGSLFGKRDAALTDRQAQIRGALDTVTGTVLTGLQAVWNNIFALPLGNFVQNGAFAGAQMLANLANGVNIGKREAEPRGQIIDSLLDHASGLFHTQVKPTIENVLNAAILQLAGVLADFSQNIIGRR